MGPQMTPKWTPGASQDALAAQFLPGAVSGPVFASFSIPPFFLFVVDEFSEILRRPEMDPKIAHNSPGRPRDPKDRPEASGEQF